MNDRTDELLHFLNQMATVRLVREFQRRCRIVVPDVEITDADILAGIIEVSV